MGRVTKDYKIKDTNIHEQLNNDKMRKNRLMWHGVWDVMDIVRYGQ